MQLSPRRFLILLQDIVEQNAFVEAYQDKVKELQHQINEKELLIDELKSLTEKNNINHNMPEIALKIAAMIETPDKDSTVLISVVKNLVENREKKTGSRCNDKTKSLFAIILDYGGPALVKIIKEKIGGLSLDTLYCTARCAYEIPMRLEQQTIQLAASFYSHIGYTGAFSLSIDATAVIPMLKVKRNRLIGLASENKVVLKSAKDIINIINDKSSKKTKQANAFLLSPLQEHVPSLSWQFRLCTRDRTISWCIIRSIKYYFGQPRKIC
jgi:hypothetical protein